MDVCHEYHESRCSSFEDTGEAYVVVIPVGKIDVDKRMQTWKNKHAR